MVEQLEKQSLYFDEAVDEITPVEPARKRRKKRVVKLDTAKEQEQDRLAAEGWGQCFCIVHSLFHLDIPVEESLALGMSLYKAVSLTWPDASPVAIAWMQFGAMATAAYAPPLMEKLKARRLQVVPPSPQDEARE